MHLWGPIIISLYSRDLGPVSISEKTSFRKISLSLEATRSVLWIVVSLWNWTGMSAALLPRCLSNFRAIGQFLIQISRLRDFTRSYGKTSFRILRRGTCNPGLGSGAPHVTYYFCLHSNDAQCFQQWRHPLRFQVEWVCAQFALFIGIYWMPLLWYLVFVSNFGMW